MATLTVEIPQSSQNILGTVTIHAPLAKVFEAHTNIDLFRQWWGRGNNLEVEAFDAQDGGAWRLTERAADGDSSFQGSFHEVSPNQRIIWTFEYLGLPERGHVALEKMEFQALDNNSTQIKTTSTYQSREDRDGMVASGMEEGWRQSIEALGKVVGED
jgi:uncharacterized protein YndB with AHSA1/START domain